MFENFDLEAWFQAYGWRVLKAIVVFIIGYLFAKLIRKMINSLCNARKFDTALAGFLANLLYYTILAATIIMSLGALGIQTTSLVAIFASAGLAIGLALQGNLSNFASGVMLLGFRPIDVGERVTVSGETGHVEVFGIFTTKLRTLDNRLLTIPNSLITNGVITNFSRGGILRGSVDVGVAYGSDVSQVIPVLERAGQSADLVLEDPAVSVAFVGLGASSLDFKVHCWCESADFLDMLHNVRWSVYDSLNEAGIEIPFSQIVVHQAEAATAAD